MARATSKQNYNVRVIGTSAEVRVALAIVWAGAVIRKAAAIHSVERSDTRQGQFESEGGPAPRVVGSGKVQGIQKVDRDGRSRNSATQPCQGKRTREKIRGH